MNSLAERVGQLMMVGFDGLKPPPHILAWLASGRIGGIYLFARIYEVASASQAADRRLPGGGAASHSSRH